MAILIVDDEEMNRKVLEEILDDAGYETVHAEDGVEAIAKLKEHGNVEVVLLDRMMPNMNGMEVMREMQSNPDWARIPVIFQTAAGAPKDVIEGSSAGAYYYLTKPYEETLVLSIVRAALRGD